MVRDQIVLGSQEFLVELRKEMIGRGEPAGQRLERMASPWPDWRTVVASVEGVKAKANDLLNVSTDPTDGQSYFHIEALEAGPPVSVGFPSSSNRVYTLFYSPALAAAPSSPPTWTAVPSQTDTPGTGGMRLLTDTNAAPHRFYRVGVNVR